MDASDFNATNKTKDSLGFEVTADDASIVGTIFGNARGSGYELFQDDNSSIIRNLENDLVRILKKFWWFFFKYLATANPSTKVDSPPLTLFSKQLSGGNFSNSWKLQIS